MKCSKCRSVEATRFYLCRALNFAGKPSYGVTYRCESCRKSAGTIRAHKCKLHTFSSFKELENARTIMKIKDALM